MNTLIKYILLGFLLMVCGAFQVGIASAATFTAAGQKTNNMIFYPNEMIQWAGATDNETTEVVIECFESGGWTTIQTIDSETAASGEIANGSSKVRCRARCTAFGVGSTTTGSTSRPDNVIESWSGRNGTVVLQINESGVTGLAGAVDGALLEADSVGIASLADDAKESLVRTLRDCISIANINAGYTILPAVAGYQYKIVNARAIAIGGQVTATDPVDVLGTQYASSVKIASFAIASLAQSTVLTAGGTGAAVLDDGWSFRLTDVNTGITVISTTGDADGATDIDIILEYILVAE